MLSIPLLLGEFGCEDSYRMYDNKKINNVQGNETKKEINTFKGTNKNNVINDDLAIFPSSPPLFPIPALPVCE